MTRHGSSKNLTGTRLTAELAAYSLSREAPDLSGRETVSGFAIDDADPHSPKDRDDAIQVEYRTDPVLGRLIILHVTIADVAGVLPQQAAKEKNPMLAALDQTAREQGKSLYFSHGSRPMFPRRLQDRMSLEHHKERMGLTTSITFDEFGNRLHTEFSRRRINTVCKSYREASADITDPGSHPNPMQRIALVAKMLLKNKPGEVLLPYYDEVRGTYVDAEGRPRHLNAEASGSYVAVQGCMQAANEAAAELLGGCNIMSRNQCALVDGKAVPYEQLPKSRKKVLMSGEYSADRLGHVGLGVRGYALITSPIRRYGDIVNQRTQHWAIDVTDALMKTIREQLRDKPHHWNEDRLRWHVWDQANPLLEKLTEYHEAGRGRNGILPKKELEGLLEDILLPIFGAAAGKAMQQRCLKAITAVPMPYLYKEVAAVASELNAKSAKPTGQQYDDMMNATLDSIFLPPMPDTDGYMPKVDMIHEAVRKRRPYKFADLLEAAARRGDCNDFFTAEVMRRLSSTEDKVELVRNLHTLLVVANPDNGRHWHKLKWTAFDKLKEDPILAQRVFNYAQGQHKPPRVFMLEATMLDRENASHPAALVVLNHEGEDYSAPMLDTGETPEAACRGAILSFFRHYGKLALHEKLYTPKLIDLALARARVKRGERVALLKKLCGDEFSIEETVTPVPSQPEKADIQLKLVRKRDGETMEKTRNGWTEFAEDYLDKCAREMIEDRRFVDMLSAQDMPPPEREVGRAGRVVFSRFDVSGGGGNGR